MDCTKIRSGRTRSGLQLLGKAADTAALMTPTARSVTHSKVTRVLSAGFALILLTSLVIGLMGIRNLRLIQEDATELVEELRLTSSLIAQIQGQLNTLRAVAHHLTNAPEAADDESIRRMLDSADSKIARIVQGGLGTPEEDRRRG